MMFQQINARYLRMIFGNGLTGVRCVVGKNGNRMPQRGGTGCQPNRNPRRTAHGGIEGLDDMQDVQRRNFL